MKNLFNIKDNVVGDEYDSAELYESGELVLHEGSLYRCSVDIDTPEEWTPSHWTEVTLNLVLATKANDSEVVHREGGEEIEGFKDFVGGIGVSSINMPAETEDADYDLTAKVDEESESYVLESIKTVARRKIIHPIVEIPFGGSSVIFKTNIRLDNGVKFVLGDSEYGLMLPNSEEWEDDRTIATVEDIASQFIITSIIIDGEE